MRSSTRHPSVVFSGYYGMDNFGDDLFGFICSSAASLFWRHAKTRLLSPSLLGVNANFAVPNIIRELYANPNSAGGVTRLIFAFREALRNDVLVLGGGSVMSSQTSVVQNVLFNSSHLTGIKLAAMGISIGPFENIQERNKARQLLSNFVFVSVRDKASYQLAEEFELQCPIVNAGDLAGLMPMLTVQEENSTEQSEQIIGLALCPYESIVGGDVGIEDQRNRALVEAVIKLANKIGARVYVFSLNNHRAFGDDALAQDICSQLSSAGIRYRMFRHMDAGVLETWQRISICSIFVSVRLHGAIAAYLNRIPFVLVEYHKKCSDFLEDIGQPENLRIKSAESDSHELFKTIENLIEQPEKPVLSVEQYTERALLHFSHVSENQLV